MRLEMMLTRWAVSTAGFTHADKAFKFGGKGVAIVGHD